MDVVWIELQNLEELKSWKNSKRARPTWQPACPFRLACPVPIYAAPSAVLTMPHCLPSLPDRRRLAATPRGLSTLSPRVGCQANSSLASPPKGTPSPALTLNHSHHHHFALQRHRTSRHAVGFLVREPSTVSWLHPYSFGRTTETTSFPLVCSSSLTRPLPPVPRVCIVINNFSTTEHLAAASPPRWATPTPKPQIETPTPWACSLIALGFGPSQGRCAALARPAWKPLWA
jgi:hypothetical protein